MSVRLNSTVAFWLSIMKESSVLWARMFYLISIGVSWVVTSTLISSKMGGSRFPMLM